jgi:hypothetical protein
MKEVHFCSRSESQRSNSTNLRSPCSSHLLPPDSQLLLPRSPLRHNGPDSRHQHAPVHARRSVMRSTRPSAASATAQATATLWPRTRVVERRRRQRRSGAPPRPTQPCAFPVPRRAPAQPWMQRRRRRRATRPCWFSLGGDGFRCVQMSVPARLYWWRGFRRVTEAGGGSGGGDDGEAEEEADGDCWRTECPSR